MDNDNKFNSSVKPYKATKNLNTIIDNPSVNVDNNLNVNIKDNDNPDAYNKEKIKEEDSIFQSRIMQNNTNKTNRTNRMEQQYIDKVFNFDNSIDSNSLSNKIKTNNSDNSNNNEDNNFSLDNKLFSNSNIKSNFHNIQDNFAENIKSFSLNNSSKNNITIPQNDKILSSNDFDHKNVLERNNKKSTTVDGNFNSKKKNTKFEFGSEFKIVIIIAIILLIFLIFLPIINRIIFGY